MAKPNTAYKSIRYIVTAILILSGIAVILFVGMTDQSQTSADVAKSNICTDPRPQICTQEYVPVCAILKDGSTKTYASGCTACSEVIVVSYQTGECE